MISRIQRLVRRQQVQGEPVPNQYLPSIRSSLRRILLSLFLFSCIFAILQKSTNVFALTQDDLNSITQGTPYYDPNAGACSTATAAPASTGSGSPLDQLLQAMAFHESHGSPTANSGNGAYGKYQFIPSTWQSSAKSFYPPAAQYARADQAPENVQDTVQYLRFISVYNAVNGDMFATAIYNYWPADLQIAHANHDDPRLNYAPPGNNGLTIKAFGQSVLDLISSGKAANIPLSYSSAPDFATWLTKAGGTPAGSSTNQTALQSNNSACGSGTSSGAVSGSIIQTAINLSWPEPVASAKPLEVGRTGIGSPKPEYVAALRQFNPSGQNVTSGADCGVFVATTLRASGVDPNYPASYTVAQAQYIIAHPEKYDIQYQVTNTTDLQPGDILILNQGSFIDGTGKYHVGAGAGAAGHTMIWLGAQGLNGYNEASASGSSSVGNNRMPNLGSADLKDSRGIYMRARVKQ
jgi:muramidase (phage lysozyme)